MWRLMICAVILAAMTLCTSKPHLRRNRRVAARRGGIPYSSLAAGIPSRVRNRLLGRTRSSASSGAPKTATKSSVMSASSDSRSSGYVSGAYGSHGYGVNTPSDSQQYESRQGVPIGKSTFPYATQGIYRGPSQTQYASQPLPVPSYGGVQAQAGYQTQQTSQSRQQPYYPQQQSSNVGYASNYYNQQPNPYGNVYGGSPQYPYGSANSYARNPYASSMPYAVNSQYPYGSSNNQYAMNPQYPYGQPSYQSGTGYQSVQGSGSIGSPYRDPTSAYTSYVHPEANSRVNPYGYSDPSYGASQDYASAGRAGYYGTGSSSSYQASDNPSSGAAGNYGSYGQNQQTNSYSSSEYRQSQQPYNSYGSSGSQYASGSLGSSMEIPRPDAQTANNYPDYGMAGSDSRSSSNPQSSNYPDYTGNRMVGSNIPSSSHQQSQMSSSGSPYVPASRQQNSLSNAQSSNYAGYAGSGRTGAYFPPSAQQQVSDISPSSRFSDQQQQSNSRAGVPLGSMPRQSSSFPHYPQGSMQRQSSQNSEEQRTSQYFNPEPVQTNSQHSSPQISLGTDHTRDRSTGGRYQAARQGSLRAGVSSDHVRSDRPSVVTSQRVPFQNRQEGPQLIPRRESETSEAGERSTQSSNPTHSFLSRCQPQDDGLPDLELKPSDMAKPDSIFLDTRSVDDLACARTENCLSTLHPEITQRKLLRFPTKIYNVGTADFTSDVPPGEWEFHTCHRHYHSMKEFAHFSLYDKNGTAVGEGHKASFCLQDSGCTNPCKPKYNCTGVEGNDKGTQAISPGCHDDYRASLDCQWIDITGISRDNAYYTLKVAVNPPIDGDRAVPELSYMNNAVTCEIIIHAAKVTVKRCHAA